MNAIILSLLINTWCANWIESENMKPQTYEQGFELYNCINQTTEADLFEVSHYTSYPDTRI